MTLPINSLLAQPWAMEPGHFAALVEDARAGRLEVRADATRAEFAPPRTRALDAVAVVPVVGPLMRAGSPVEEMMAAMFGATSYGAIQSAVAEASRAGLPIVLDINSPGGSVDGAAETADAIRAAAARVPVVAFVRGMGASAAYWLASGASRIVAARGARVGSVGVVATLFDDAGAQATEGVRRVQVVSSVSPDKRSEPLDSDVLARVQQHVDEIAAEFVADVATGRGVDAGRVVQDFGRGDVMGAARGRAVGMVDEVGSFAAAISYAVDESKKRRTGMNTNQPAAQAEALAALGADALRLFKCESLDEAAGALVAAAEALAEIGPLRAEVTTLRATANRQELRAVLERGIAAGRLSLGDLSATVPNMLTDEARIAAMCASLDARAETTAAATLDAICGVEVTVSEVKRIAGWADRKAPTMAAPVAAPVRDVKTEANDAEALDSDARRVAEAADRARKVYDRNRNHNPAATAAK